MYDSQCPVCMQIYLQPVTLPCEHCVCKPCFEQILKQSNLQCPMCRRRIGSWARLHTRNGSLVDEIKWKYMQKNYSAEIKARLSGAATPLKSRPLAKTKKKKKGPQTNDEGEDRDDDPVMRDIAQTGEIRMEYEQELLKVQQERAQQELASEKLIKEILAQDEKELAAFRVANKENKPAAASSQMPRLSLPRRSSSLDSITGEFSRYFKPIARYPRTPPRPTEKDKGYPETIKVTPCPQTVKRLDFASSCSPPDAKSTVSGENSNSHSIIGKERLEIVSKAETSAASKKDDHMFLLPLQTIVDEQSNDGMSLVSASSDTSISNCRLRISTSSPIIPFFPSERCATERSGATSDTMSFRSDISSPEVKRKRCLASSTKAVKKNGFVNNKSTKSQQQVIVNGGKRTRSRGRTLSTASNSTTSSRSRNGSSSVSNARTRNRSVNSTASASPCDTTLANGTATTNGHDTEPAFVDPDEQCAKKWQELYNIETKYRLTAIRGPGSGNEYNTRKRSKTESSS